MTIRHCSLILASFLALPLCAAELGSSVIVIYNSRVPESKEVAEHYARQRQVPAGQVLGFALPIPTDKDESMTRTEFIDELKSRCSNNWKRPEFSNSPPVLIPPIPHPLPFR